MRQPLSKPPLDTPGWHGDYLGRERVISGRAQQIGESSRQDVTAGSPMNNEHGRPTFLSFPLR
jgi:hypothetical protein